MKPKSHAERLRELHPVERGRHVADRDDHLRRRLDPVQREADRLRSSGRWKSVRRWKLNRNPLCEDCRRLDRVVEAVDVDHIVPVMELIRRGDPESVFDPDGLQALCRAHHNEKTAAERRDRLTQGAAAPGATGRPLIAPYSEDGSSAIPVSNEAKNGAGGATVSVYEALASERGEASQFSRVSPFSSRPPGSSPSDGAYFDA